MQKLMRIRNRKLEQFLHVHGIKFQATGKDEDGMTWWEYRKTDWFNRVFQEYKEVVRRTKI